MNSAEGIVYNDIDDEDFDNYFSHTGILWPDPEQQGRKILLTVQRDRNYKVLLFNDDVRVILDKQTFLEEAGKQTFPRLGFADLFDVMPVFIAVEAGRNRRKLIDRSLLKMHMLTEPPTEEQVRETVMQKFLDIREAVMSEVTTDGVVSNDTKEHINAYNDMMGPSLYYQRENDLINTVPAHCIEQIVNMEYVSTEKALNELFTHNSAVMGRAISPCVALLGDNVGRSVAVFMNAINVGRLDDTGMFTSAGTVPAYITEYAKQALSI